MTSLCRGKDAFSTIALEAGFFDQSHFTTAFKRHFGHAPGVYRESLSGLSLNPQKVSFLQETLGAGQRS